MIDRIHIKQFKSIINLSFELGRINVIIGENGCGKTNILEALYFCALGRSFRTFKENELIKFLSEFSNFLKR